MLVGADGDEVAAGGADVLDHRVERNVGILLAQALHLVVDGLRLHRAAAGLLMRTTTPCVFLSLNAACSALVILSALASVPGAITPFTSTIAVCFLPPPTPRLPVHRHEQDQHVT